MEERRYEVIVTGHEETHMGEYIREVLSKLDSVSGIVDVHIERLDATERDISEVERILSDISDEELQDLQDVIDAYTEEGEE